MHTFWSHALISSVKLPETPDPKVVASTVYWPD